MVKKVNKSLKDWVAFIKKVQKEENLSYPDAMKRAKVRKDKGENWMSGGKKNDADGPQSSPISAPEPTPSSTNSVQLNGGKKNNSDEPQSSPISAPEPTPSSTNQEQLTGVEQPQTTITGISQPAEQQPVGGKGGSKKQKTSKKQKKTSKKQKGGRRKTCYKK